MTKIYLEPSQVPAALRGAYNGKRFAATITPRVTIPADAGLWSGGTRESYSLISLETGQAYPNRMEGLSPFGNQRKEITIDLDPGMAIVRHSVFCGKDMGLEFFIHPDNAPAFLPSPESALTPFERYVLTATRSLKSSYGGRDRYQMAQTEYSCQRILSDAGEQFPSRAQWNETKAVLIAKGLLTKAGAITPAGRNAVPH